jgi:hypothetical protein
MPEPAPKAVTKLGLVELVVDVVAMKGVSVNQ